MQDFLYGFNYGSSDNGNLASWNGVGNQPFPNHQPWAASSSARTPHATELQFADSGTLPSGVTFNTGTGVLSGTPGSGTVGTYPVVFTASNGVNPNATQSFTLSVNPVAPVITSGNNTIFAIGSSGLFTVTAIGSPTPTLSESGTLPSGISFNTSTGVLSGTPASGTNGAYSITFTAMNGTSPNATQSFTLTVDNTGTVFYYFQDQLGSARVVTNATGAVLDDSDFYPFGGERPVVGPSSGNTYKFTGKERDSESGLDNFGARYDSSQYGRFMTPDSPSYSNRKNPQSWNLYAYALNNPVSFRDADGHEIDCANNTEQCQKDAAAATANAEAAKRVTLNTTTTQHSFLGLFHWTTTTTQIGISGDINSFRALSPNASKLADLVTSKQTVTVSYDQFARPSFFANGEQLNGGSMSYTASQGYNWQASIDPNRTPGVVYDQDAVDQHIPQANTGEEFGHEVLGHIWGEMFGGAPAGTRGNMRDSIIGEDAVRALDPTRGQKGLDSHHNMPSGDQ